MTETTAFSRIGIIGGTTSGITLSALALGHGHEVVMVASSEPLGAIIDRVERGRMRGTIGINHAKESLFRLRFGPLAEATTCDLVIDATADDLEAKSKLLGSLDSAVAKAVPIVVISALWDLMQLGRECARAGRMLRAYLPDPQEDINIVELAGSKQTSGVLLDSVFTWFGDLGQRVFLCEDTPGFTIVRLDVAEALEAIRLVEAGGLIEAIDESLMLAKRLPMGPLRRSDLVGLDVRLLQAQSLAPLGSRFSAPDLLVEMVESGQHGRKSGHGFYDW